MQSELVGYAQYTSSISELCKSATQHIQYQKVANLAYNPTTVEELRRVQALVRQVSSFCSSSQHFCSLAFPVFVAEPNQPGASVGVRSTRACSRGNAGARVSRQDLEWWDGAIRGRIVVCGACVVAAWPESVKLVYISSNRVQKTLRISGTNSVHSCSVPENSRESSSRVCVR